MKKLSNRMRKTLHYIDKSEQYKILDGLRLLKKMTPVQFVESVDVAINLGIDSRKSDQNVRNYVIMPHGIGRIVRVAVFTQGENIKLSKEAGADLVGLQDLYDRIKKEGCNNFDVVLASSDVMHIVSKLGPILGPRGLMPNLKMGTISDDIVKSIKTVKLGQVRYKNDKNGIIHAILGKINFELICLQENLEALISSIKQIRPIQCKGTYIRKISISTTMGRSVVIDRNSLRIPVY